MGNTKHEVEIADRQQFLSSGAEPLLACIGLTLRTMTVSTRVIGNCLMPTTQALIAMTAQRGRAAAFDRSQDFELRRG